MVRVLPLACVFFTRGIRVAKVIYVACLLMIFIRSQIMQRNVKTENVFR